MRIVPKSIKSPDWAATGIPKGEQCLSRTKIDILDAKGQEALRKVCRLAREVLDITAAEIKPGVTTDYLDEICHEPYPSPLNYNHFPKSLCTSVNEVVCPRTPDQRILLDGDINNLDISLYHGADPSSARVVETTCECLKMAVELVKPGTPIRVTTWGGLGVNTEFHPPPWIPHYDRNKAVGVCKTGMTFTVEPILALGSPRVIHWPDAWTNVTADGKWTAQFGVEVLTAQTADSLGGPALIPTMNETTETI
ncbi:peptidase M24, structural domain-containing protein [Aspergillus similis]